jgi:hypothetical protein
MLRVALVLALTLPTVAASAATPPDTPAASLASRAAQLAETFVALCRSDDMGLAAFQVRARSLGFAAQPASHEVADRAFGGTVHIAQLALLTRDTEAQAPVLTARMEEDRDHNGTPGHWRCEVWMPASAEAPPRREVDAVLEAITPILGPRQWTLRSEAALQGDFHIAEQRVEGFLEAYLAADGQHRLGRMPEGPAIVTQSLP